MDISGKKKQSNYSHGNNGCETHLHAIILWEASEEWYRHLSGSPECSEAQVCFDNGPRTTHGKS